MRKNYLKKLSPEAKRILRQAQAASRFLKMPAYLVGGSLRDLILGKKNFDLDITVEGDGLIFARYLSKKLKSGLIIHERFKTATLLLEGDLKLDIATARRETYPYPAALPAVVFSSLREDLGRRDFTINALAIDLTLNNEAGIIDLFQGLDDLAAGNIRVLHDLSFEDDPTRILRAIRFGCRFGFKLERRTLILLKRALKEKYLKRVNPHRLRDELILLFKEDRPWGPLKTLDRLGGLSFIGDNFRLHHDTQRIFGAIKRQIIWFEKNFSFRRPLEPWLVYFAALLIHLSLAQASELVNRLGLAKGQASRLLSYHRVRHRLVAALCRPAVKADTIFSLVEPLSYETIILFKAVVANKYFQQHLADFLKLYNGMRLCVGGRDLKNLGVLPGPRYQKILAKVLAAKLQNKVCGRQAELILIKKLAVKNKERSA